MAKNLGLPLESGGLSDQPRVFVKCYMLDLEAESFVKRQEARRAKQKEASTRGGKQHH